jgi:hypothetical protein
LKDISQFSTFSLGRASIEDFEENPYFAAATAEEKKRVWRLAKKKIPNSLMDDYWISINTLCEEELQK